MIWRVVVLCERLKERTRPKLVRSKVKVLVEAPDDDEAFKSAVEWAQMNAPIGPKWQSFTAMEASRVTLPKFVANL